MAEYAASTTSEAAADRTVWSLSKKVMTMLVTAKLKRKHEYLLRAVCSESRNAQLRLEELKTILEPGDWEKGALVTGLRSGRRTYDDCQNKCDIPAW